MKIELPPEILITELARNLAQLGLIIDAKARADGSHRARWAKPTHQPQPPREVTACTQHS